MIYLYKGTPRQGIKTVGFLDHSQLLSNLLYKGTPRQGIKT